MLYYHIKRVLDILGALIAIIILAVPLLLIALIIKLTSTGPVFFKQKRVGLDKQHFNILKFRTMRIDTPKDTPTHLLANPDQYLTKIGRILRRTSLDELPQLINILAGQMSFVGPRPALWNQYDLVTERDRYTGFGVRTANQVYPGLTGWAQINGRDELPIAVKARLDGEYVQRFGPAMDIQCILKTFLYVFKGRGVVEGGTGILGNEQPRTEADGNREDGAGT